MKMNSKIFSTNSKILMKKSISRQMEEFAIKLIYEDVPEEVIHVITNSL